MKGATLVIALALTVAMGLAGIASAEENGVKAAEPATAETQKATAPEKETQKVTVNEEEARKIVAAKVNGVDITLDQVIKMTNYITLQTIKAQGHEGGGPDRESIKREAMDRLIVTELAYQKAKSLGIKAEQKDIDAALNAIKTSQGGEEAYKESLEKDHLTEQMLRAQIERSIMLERIFAKEVLEKISVPEEKMKEEYEKEKGKFVQPEKISLVDVVIAPDASADAHGSGVGGKAEAILKKIRENGNDPNKLAQDGTFTVREYEPNKEKDKELIEAAEKLKVGELSGIIKAGDGLHIIKLKERVPEKQLAYDEVKSLIEAKLKAHEQSQLTKEWTEALEKDAKVEILLR